MKSKIFGMEPVIPSYGILIIGVILALITLFGLTNGFSGVEIPQEYDILIGK